MPANDTFEQACRAVDDELERLQALLSRIRAAARKIRKLKLPEAERITFAGIMDRLLEGFRQGQLEATLKNLDMTFSSIEDSLKLLDHRGR